MAAPEGASSQTPSARFEEILTTAGRVKELGIDDGDDEYEDMETITGQFGDANQAWIQSVTSPLQDLYETGTSKVQDETLEVVLPFLEGNPNGFDVNSHGIPKLQREKHAAFLKNALGSYPAAFAAMDASRPWILYWGLQGLTALGYDVSKYKERVVYTFAAAQHPKGGFGGGHGQLPHLAATYAAVLSLVMVGGEESVNRKTMWEYLGQMKQADGGFTMAPNGEEDIRGAFCALVTLTLLNLPLGLPPEAPAREHGVTNFLDGLGEWITRCQTFEGGISASPGNEAHGAYAFCGLGCLAIMGPPQETLHKYLDIPLLTHWLASRQCSPEGGYNGRTNKLVDGCYSHWVGGCWPILEAATLSNICNRTALARYILGAAQFKKGGLVDKPGKRPDAYHTCYNLAGLSAVQWRNEFDRKMEGSVGKSGNALGAPFHWRNAGWWKEGKVWDEDDMVEAVHPVFVVPWGAAERCRSHFERHAEW